MRMFREACLDERSESRRMCSSSISEASGPRARTSPPRPSRCPCGSAVPQAHLSEKISRTSMPTIASFPACDSTGVSPRPSGCTSLRRPGRLGEYHRRCREFPTFFEGPRNRGSCASKAAGRLRRCCLRGAACAIPHHNCRMDSSARAAKNKKAGEKKRSASCAVRHSGTVVAGVISRSDVAHRRPDCRGDRCSIVVVARAASGSGLGSVSGQWLAEYRQDRIPNRCAVQDSALCGGRVSSFMALNIRSSTLCVCLAALGAHVTAQEPVNIGVPDGSTLASVVKITGAAQRP